MNIILFLNKEEPIIHLLSGAGMGMMAPVCSTVFPAEDGLLQHKVKVLLRIPSQFQDNPPSPSDESIRVEKREEMVVYST